MTATSEGSSSSLGSTELALARPVDLELARRPLSPSPSTSTTMNPRENLRFLPPQPAPSIWLFAACSSSFQLLPGSDLTRSFLDLLPANRPRPCLDRSLPASLPPSPRGDRPSKPYPAPFMLWSLVSATSRAAAESSTELVGPRPGSDPAVRPRRRPSS
ncbi:unnamed protein product [Urochloa humidicola]